MFSCLVSVSGATYSILVCPLSQVGFYFLLLRLAKGRVEEVRNMIFAAVATYQVHLVFHQGDKRGNDNGHTFA